MSGVSSSYPVDTDSSCHPFVLVVTDTPFTSLCPNTPHHRNFQICGTQLRNGPKEINQHDESVPYPIVDGTLPALSLSLSLFLFLFLCRNALRRSSRAAHDFTGPGIIPQGRRGIQAPFIRP